MWLGGELLLVPDPVLSLTEAGILISGGWSCLAVSGTPVAPGGAMACLAVLSSPRSDAVVAVAVVVADVVEAGGVAGAGADRVVLCGSKSAVDDLFVAVEDIVRGVSVELCGGAELGSGQPGRRWVEKVIPGPGGTLSGTGSVCGVCGML